MASVVWDNFVLLIFPMVKWGIYVSLYWWSNPISGHQANTWGNATYIYIYIYIYICVCVCVASYGISRPQLVNILCPEIFNILGHILFYSEFFIKSAVRLSTHTYLKTVECMLLFVMNAFNNSIVSLIEYKTYLCKAPLLSDYSLVGKICIGII